METYYSAVPNASSWKTYAEKHNSPKFCDLPYKSGSNWTPEYLPACRLRCAQQLSRLLSPPGRDKRVGKKCIAKDNDEAGKENLPIYRNLMKFLKGPPDRYAVMDPEERLQTCTVLSKTWKLLSQFVIPPLPTDRKTRLQPQSSTMSNESNDSQSSNSSLGSNNSRGEEAWHEKDQQQSSKTSETTDVNEIVSEHLIGSVLDFILPALRSHYGPSGDGVIDYREDHYTPKGVTTPKLKREICATDDGALQWRARMEPKMKDYHTKPVMPFHKQLAIIEAKRCLKNFGDGDHFIADEMLAQMLCQAIGARLQRHANDPRTDQLEASNRVYNICVDRARVCFLRFTITMDYLNDFENEYPSEFADVEATWFLDLNVEADRRSIIDNLAMITRDCGNWMESLR